LLSARQYKSLFIENMRFLNHHGIYGKDGIDYSDNKERFIFFQKAVLELVKALMFRDDIIHEQI
jgi:starch synthase